MVDKDPGFGSTGSKEKPDKCPECGKDYKKRIPTQDMFGSDTNVDDKDKVCIGDRALYVHVTKREMYKRLYGG